MQGALVNVCSKDGVQIKLQAFHVDAVPLHPTRARRHLVLSLGSQTSVLTGRDQIRSEPLSGGGWCVSGGHVDQY